MVSANVRRGGISPYRRGVSRGERFDRCLRPRARSRRQGIERNRRRTNDFARPRVRQPNVKPTGLARAGVAEHEVDQRRRRSTAPADSRPHLDPLLPHRTGQLDTLRILLLDDDAVAAEGMRNAASPTGQREQNTRRHDGTTHGSTRLAPTHRATHQAPSASCASRRDSFTPEFALWMNVCSPTYIPTWVTPPPGCAE